MMSWCDQTVFCRCRFGRLELIDTGSGAMFDEETVELRPARAAIHENFDSTPIEQLINHYNHGRCSCPA